MGILGTGADLASDVLILGEVVVSLLVWWGVRSIRHGRHVGRHRRLMLSVLLLNAILLASFLYVDVARSETVLARGRSTAFYVALGIHLPIAVSALTIAVISWLIARKGIVPKGDTIDLEPSVRARHIRVSRWYPWLWGATLATGLLLYASIYV